MSRHSDRSWTVITDPIDAKRQFKRWTLKEDVTLLEALFSCSSDMSDWKAIAKEVGTRTPSQCYHHWYRVLGPKVGKTQFSRGEYFKLAHSIRHFGPDWGRFQKIFKKRSQIQLMAKMHELMSSKDPFLSDLREYLLERICKEDVAKKYPPSDRSDDLHSAIVEVDGHGTSESSLVPATSSSTLDLDSRKTSLATIVDTTSCSKEKNEDAFLAVDEKLGGEDMVEDGLERTLCERMRSRLGDCHEEKDGYPSPHVQNLSTWRTTGLPPSSAVHAEAISRVAETDQPSVSLLPRLHLNGQFLDEWRALEDLIHSSPTKNERPSH